jgi:hypothetical protein
MDGPITLHRPAGDSADAFFCSTDVRVASVRLRRRWNVLTAPSRAQVASEEVSNRQKIIRSKKINLHSRERGDQTVPRCRRFRRSLSCSSVLSRCSSSFAPRPPARTVPCAGAACFAYQIPCPPSPRRWVESRRDLLAELLPAAPSVSTEPQGPRCPLLPVVWHAAAPAVSLQFLRY